MRHALFLFLLVLSTPSRAAAGPLRLSALFEWERAPGRQDYAGFLLLDVPLERFARPRVPLLPAPAQLGMLSEEPAPEAPPRRSTPVRPRALPARSLRRLLRAALETSGQQSIEQRLESLSARMRAAAVLPELTLRAARSTNEQLRLSPNGTYVYDYTQTGGAGLIFEARATWKLDHLVFADEELHVERLRMQRDRVRERVVELLLKHLHAWQRARSRLLATSEALGDEERASVEAELDSAEAALDVLTDGAFSAELPSIEGSAAR
jgi:hypothetical protein